METCIKKGREIVEMPEEALENKEELSEFCLVKRLLMW